MKIFAYAAIALVGCGGGSSAGTPQPLAVTVVSNAAGTATLPEELQIATDSVFMGNDFVIDWNVAEADLAPFTGAVVASLAVPGTYGDLLSIFAQGNPIPPAQSVITVTSGASKGDCQLAFTSGALATADKCTVDLFSGKVVYPEPAAIDLTATLNTGNATLSNVDIAINSGTARGAVWFQRGTLTQLAAPTTGKLGAVSAGLAAGDIVITPPPTLTSPLTATFIAFFDENGDGILQPSEVVSGDVKLSTSTAMSTLLPPAQVQTVLTALEAAKVNYILVAVVKSATGDILKSTSIDVKANLSFTATGAVITK